MRRGKLRAWGHRCTPSYHTVLLGWDGTAVVEGPVPWVPWSAWVRWVLTYHYCSKRWKPPPRSRGTTQQPHHGQEQGKKVEGHTGHRGKHTHTSRVLADKALLHLSSPTWLHSFFLAVWHVPLSFCTGSLDDKKHESPKHPATGRYPSVNQPTPSRFSGTVTAVYRKCGRTRPLPGFEPHLSTLKVWILRATKEAIATPSGLYKPLGW